MVRLKTSFKFPYSQLVPFGRGSAWRSDLRLCQTCLPNCQHPNATSTELAERTSFQTTGSIELDQNQRFWIDNRTKGVKSSILENSAASSAETKDARAMAEAIDTDLKE
jgi:hypothetical protein